MYKYNIYVYNDYIINNMKVISMRKPILYITVGVSASGKTTWAEQKVNDDEKNGITTVNINRDTIRFTAVCPGSNWSTYKFTKAREAEVTNIANEMFNIAVQSGYDIIISDTNLNKTYRDMWIKRGEDNDYQVEIVDFPITLEEAWKRDTARANGVGHTIIYQQYKQWEDYIGIKKYVADESKPKAIIVDVDGTIADKGKRNPFQWDRVGEDTPRKFIIDIIKNYWSNRDIEIIFLSGRDSICEHETLEWIDTHFGIMYQSINLYMRAKDDMRKDAIIKEELFWKHIADNYNVIAAFDDRPVIIRLWHKLGIPNVICVSDPFIEF